MPPKRMGPGETSKASKANSKANPKAKEKQVKAPANGTAESTEQESAKTTEAADATEPPKEEEHVDAEDTKAEPEAVESNGDAAPADTKLESEEATAPATEPTDTTSQTSDTKQSIKRKDADAPADKPNKKRRSEPKPFRPGERKSARGAQSSQPTQSQLLSYLLSPAALCLCRPQDETSDLESRDANTRTYASTPLTPFEELVSALVLSRPISHVLGLRTIRTLLNPPYAFTTPGAIIAAGAQKRAQALQDARTQHKDKTAEQLGLLADTVMSKFAEDGQDASLEKLRAAGKKDWDLMRDLLLEVKGLGKTGLDIFFRRVQWAWPEAFPFVDLRTARGLEKLGLPRDAEGLREVVEGNWGVLDEKRIEGTGREEKIRRAFVVVCERATAADLEGKSAAVLEAAAGVDA